MGSDAAWWESQGWAWVLQACSGAGLWDLSIWAESQSPPPLETDWALGWKHQESRAEDRTFRQSKNQLR